MSAEDFRAARRRLGLTQQQLAAALEIAVFTVKCYERGTWSDGRPALVPRIVALAPAGRKLEALRARGICAHGYIQQRMAHNGAMGNPKRAEAFAALKPGQVICNDCGAVFANSIEHQEARDEILSR